jgi:hypothetical protein
VPASELRFCVAGLEVVLAAARPGSLDGMAGSYREYPSAGGRPGLELEVERVPGLGQGRARGRAYPAFDAVWMPPDTVALSRFDAEGRVVVPAEADAPVRARFRVGDSANSLEAAIRIGMSMALPRRGALVLHASAIAAGGQALIFAGKSGAGKSTIATMLAAQGYRKLSDELLVLAPRPSTTLPVTDGKSTVPGAGADHRPGGAPGAQDEIWEVHVAPFLGAPDLPHRARVPAGGLHFLVQAPHHQRTRLPRPEALRELLRHVLVYVAEPGTAAHVLAAAARLVGAVPSHRLAFALDPGVVGVLSIT